MRKLRGPSSVESLDCRSQNQTKINDGRKTFACIIPRKSRKSRLCKRRRWRMPFSSRIDPSFEASKWARKDWDNQLRWTNRTLEETQKSNWPKLLNKLVHAYNCTQHSSTGFTPFQLMFGREAILPIDLMLKPSDRTQQKSHAEYVKQWEKQMHEV